MSEQRALRCPATTRVFAEAIRCRHMAGHAGWHRGSQRGIESVWTDALYETAPFDADTASSPARIAPIQPPESAA